MKVLSISLDWTVASTSPSVPGDCRERQLRYAKYIDSYFILVKAPRDSGLQPTAIASNAYVWPIRSLTRYHFMLDSFRLGSSLCLRHNIDVITSSDPFALGLVGYLLKKRFGIPLNVMIHGDFMDNPFWNEESLENRLLNRLGKWVIRRSDVARVSTQAERDKLLRLGMPDDRIFAFPIPITLNKFLGADGRELRETLMRHSFDHMVLFVGRLVYPKDVPTLLQAFSRVVCQKPRTLLVVVGGGPQLESLRKLAAGLAIQENVLFAGARAHDEVAEFLGACDVFVLPSVYEGSPLALAEAMACGKPVAVTDYAAATELVVHGETGLMGEKRNAEQLASNILALLDEPQRAAEMGARGRDRILSILGDQERLIEKTVEVWRKTASLKGSGGRIH